MNIYIIFSVLLILLLMKRIWHAQKKLKAMSHYTVNLNKKEEMIDELYDETFELKRKAMLMEYRIEQSGKEVERQKQINLKIVDYYDNKYHQIDIPLKHGRFFDYHAAALKETFVFCVN